MKDEALQVAGSRMGTAESCMNVLLPSVHDVEDSLSVAPRADPERLENLGTFKLQASSLSPPSQNTQLRIQRMGRPGAGQWLQLSTVIVGLAGRGELACALGRFTERFCRFFHDGSRLLLLLASSADVAWVSSTSAPLCVGRRGSSSADRGPRTAAQRPR